MTNIVLPRVGAHLMLSHGDPRRHLQGVQRIEEHKVLAELAIKRKPDDAAEALRHHLLTFSNDVFEDERQSPALDQQQHASANEFRRS